VGAGGGAGGRGGKNKIKDGAAGDGAKKKTGGDVAAHKK